MASKLPLGKAPEPSSTLLKMHRLYTLHPPHDPSLYNVLDVSPNATEAEITKAYRKKSRELHPDKRRHNDKNTTTSDKNEELLEQVREAFEILKDDKTRLVYHRYGLVDTSVAALILTGGRSSHSIPTKEQRQLLHLMGFGPKRLNPKTTRLEQRIMFLAANLVEKIRPLVEGAVSEATLAEAIARECDVLKHLPLGAQITRCIGRAYRHVGQRALKNRNNKFSDNLHDSLRHAKHIASAAVASGKLALTEQITSSKRGKKRNRKEMHDPKAIGYHMHDENGFPIDGLLGEDDYDDVHHHVKTEEDIRRLEQIRAQNALIEALQVEALWKITKVDLDRTIQEACNLVLSGEYFFFPSHQSRKRSDWTRGGDGWVGSTGHAIDERQARLRAAKALVLMGNVMVQCSKEGTSWME